MRIRQAIQRHQVTVLNSTLLVDAEYGIVRELDRSKRLRMRHRGSTPPLGRGLRHQENNNSNTKGCPLAEVDGYIQLIVGSGHLFIVFPLYVHADGVTSGLDEEVNA